MPNKPYIIDAHCHVYPDKIADRATASVGEFYNVVMTGDGSVRQYLNLQESAGVAKSIIMSVALKPENVITINDFIASQVAENPSFIGFATMHPDFADIEGEVERCLGMGLCGFKIHPDSQLVNADDPRMMRLYAAIQGRVPITIHAGDYRYDYSHPRRIREILHAFPGLVVNAAHFGGWSIYDLALEYLEDEACFMDLSSAQMWLGPRRTRELIGIYGAGRILFGSDFPMASPAAELDRLAAAGIDERSRELILSRNTEAFLGIDLVR
ncbi:MAG: amidohydrolase family protein [Coriobacteriia bacterium]|nr:amidohydrolase family protein [Coriobacteriia bacterium]MCL2136645.1 amidohydrolase family protein [Coriobacteriia bacterium]